MSTSLPHIYMSLNFCWISTFLIFYSSISMRHTIFWKSMMRSFRWIWIVIIDLDFLLRSAQICKKCIFFGNLRIISQKGKKESGQMTQFFHLLFELTVFHIHFCIWKISIFFFIGSFLWSILVCKILEFWRWMLWVTEYARVTLLKLNKLVNADLKHLVKWLNTNKISLNVKQTEMVIFKSQQKKFEGDLK